jgi:pimeloyl-ACP methyl ester carboxylesterase
MSQTVVLVHGLWMTGVDMGLLRLRLRRCGFDAVQFSYPSLRCNISQNAARLNRFVGNINAAVIHFVGHSLGGLVIRQFFHDFPAQRPGRVVTLGTPHNGSLVAQRLRRTSLGRMMLGRGLEPGLLGAMPSWDCHRDIGVIAGTLSIGIGNIIRGLPRPNDGTVAVSETTLAGMTEQLQVHVSHTALLFSKEVVKQTCGFLYNGRFIR